MLIPTNPCFPDSALRSLQADSCAAWRIQGFAEVSPIQRRCLDLPPARLCLPATSTKRESPSSRVTAPAIARFREYQLPLQRFATYRFLPGFFSASVDP